MKNLGVKVRNEMYQKMKQYADSNGMSLSELIRTSVEHRLNGKTQKVEPAFDVLQRELEVKNQQLEDLEEARKRSDTIIMQLTRQLENQNRMLEDMRNKSIWRRLKTAFGFAAS